MHGNVAYSPSFKTAFQSSIMQWEGGAEATLDAADRGGLTKYGISQRAHPDVDVARLTKDKAMEIYYWDYWRAGACDRMPRCVALPHFDACVNMGVSQANRVLQSAVGVDTDGVVGHVTLDAVQQVGCSVLRDLAAWRITAYATMTVKRPRMLKFIHGWVRRTIEVTIP